jgi:hypothetical protein
MSAQTQPTPTSSPSSGRLTTWKQIALHFDRSVRTVQRWESHQGLPVHRLPTARGESVYATVAELDRWASSAAGVATTLGSDEQSAVPQNDVEQEGSAATAAPAEVAAGALRSRPAPTSPPHRPRARHAALVLLALVAVAVGWWYFMSSRAQPSSFRVDQDTLIVLDGRGSTLWTRELPFRMQPQSEYERLDREFHRPASIFGDLDGDGRREVVFAARSADLSGLVRCYEMDGTVRWDRKPEHTAHFGQGQMGPPWIPMFVSETGEQGGRPEIWVTWAHHPEFASFVERLDIKTGRPLETYWSPGHITAIAAERIGWKDLLAVGASNNEFHGGSVAVFERSESGGTAPAADDGFRCSNCPVGKPVAFFVFPKLSQAAQLSGWDAELVIYPLHFDAAGQVFATVRQIQPVGEVLYRIDAALKVVRADLLPSFETACKGLHRSGKVARPFDRQESNRELWPVRSWVGDGYVLINGPQVR